MKAFTEYCYICGLTNSCCFYLVTNTIMAVFIELNAQRIYCTVYNDVLDLNINVN
jgi:hypothetical protein